MRQAQLLLMIRNGDHGVAVPPPLSIFDAMRRTALAVPAAPGMAQNLRDFVALQHAKLT